MINKFNKEYLTKQQKQDIYNTLRLIDQEKDLLSKQVAFINESPTVLKDTATGNIVYPHTIYVGEREDPETGGFLPNYEHAVMDYDKFNAAINVVGNAYASSTEIDKAVHDPFYPQFQPYAPLFYESLAKQKLNPQAVGVAKADSMMTSQDFSTINIVTYAGALIARRRKAYPLVDAIQTEFTTDMVFPEVYEDPFQIDAEIGEGQKAKPKKPAFYKRQFVMKKSGTQIQWTDEMLKQGYIVNPLERSKAMITEGIRKVYEDKLLALLASASFSDISGELYTGYTNGRSDNNPLTKIQEAELAIYTADGTANTIVMSPKTLYLFLSNDNIKGQFGLQGLPGLDGVYSSPLMPGYRIIVDPNYPNTKLMIFDDSILKRKQGTVVVGTKRDIEDLTTKYIYFNFNTCYVTDVSKGKRLTGVTS